MNKPKSDEATDISKQTKSDDASLTDQQHPKRTYSKASIASNAEAKKAASKSIFLKSAEDDSKKKSKDIVPLSHLGDDDLGGWVGYLFALEDDDWRNQSVNAVALDSKTARGNLISVDQPLHFCSPQDERESRLTQITETAETNKEKVTKFKHEKVSNFGSIEDSSAENYTSYQTGQGGRENHGVEHAVPNPLGSGDAGFSDPRSRLTLIETTDDNDNESGREAQLGQDAFGGSDPSPPPEISSPLTEQEAAQCTRPLASTSNPAWLPIQSHGNASTQYGKIAARMAPTNVTDVPLRNAERGIETNVASDLIELSQSTLSLIAKHEQVPEDRLTQILIDKNILKVQQLADKPV